MVKVSEGTAEGHVDFECDCGHCVIDLPGVSRKYLTDYTCPQCGTDWKIVPVFAAVRRR